MMREGFKRVRFTTFLGLLFISSLPYAAINAQNNKKNPSVFGRLNSGNSAGVLTEFKKFSLESIANWEHKRIDIELSVPIDKLELQTRYYVQDIIESNFSVWLYEAVKNLQINSQQTLNDFWGSASFKNSYTSLKVMLKKKYAVFYRNLKSFRAAYQIDLYPDLMRVWLHDQFQNEELPAAILKENVAEFTGLIIYVENELPVRGEPYSSVKLKPALFPKIYDPNLNLVMSYRNVERAMLLEHGMLSYGVAPDKNRHKDRVGNFPLRIVARGLFGTAHTDLIISDSDANSLLENVYMREALQQGRILVLYESASSDLLNVGKE